MTAEQAAVRTTALTRRFKQSVAVDHVDIEIRRGEIFGLVGPNGAGKTTLIRILCAILRPTSGEVTVLGHDVQTNADQIRRSIGYVSQAFSLYRELTIAENLRFYRDVYGTVTRDAVRDVARRVGLTDRDLDSKVDELPTGIRQRAALAAAVLHDPPLLVLDEPTSGVDPTGRRDFWHFMRDLASRGTTVIVSTHVMTEAERCDRVALMVDGRVLACDSPMTLATTSHAAIAKVDADPWQDAYNQLKARWPGTALKGHTIHVPIPADTDLSTVTFEDVRVRRIEVAPPTFEDTFAWYVRRAAHRATPGPWTPAAVSGDHRPTSGNRSPGSP